MKLPKILEACRVDKPRHFRLAGHDPAETFGLSTNIEDVKPMLADGVARLGEMQRRLYAHGECAVLIVLQAMDAAGKDGVDHARHVRHQSARLQRTRLQSSQCGRTGARFSMARRQGAARARAYRYLQSLALRGSSGGAGAPRDVGAAEAAGRRRRQGIWEHRFKDIRAFEQHLVRNGTLVLKFHLRISKEEQRKRFLARLDEPMKRWKFSMDDVTERRRWDDYMAAYQDMIREHLDRRCAVVCCAGRSQARRLADRLRGNRRCRWRSSNSITPRSWARRLGIEAPNARSRRKNLPCRQAESKEINGCDRLTAATAVR